MVSETVVGTSPSQFFHIIWVINTNLFESENTHNPLIKILKVFIMTKIRINVVYRYTDFLDTHLTL